MNKNFVIIITLSILIFDTHAHSQDLFKEVSKVEYNFGSVEHIRDSYIHNNLLFVLGTTHFAYPGPETYAVAIFDISDPKNPEELGRNFQGTFSGNPEYANYVSYFKETQLSLPYYSLADSNNQPLHYFWQPNKCIFIGDLLFEFQDWQQSINIYREKSPAEFNFIRRDSIANSIREITGIKVVGTTLYITNRGSGLIILDTSNPDSLIEIENQFENIDLTGIVIGNDKAIIGKAFSNLELLDISDPKNPLSITTKAFHNNRLSGFWNNDKFYLSGYTSKLAIFDINLNLLNEIPTTGYFLEFLIDKNNLIVESNFGLEIYDILNENEPDLQTRYGAHLSKPVSFEKKNNLLFIANLGDGLTILDVSDSTAPVTLSNYDLNGYSLDIAVHGDYAYIADYLIGLVVLDISDPEVPQIISTVPIDSASALDIKGDELFIVNDNNTLFVVDISDKSEPKIEFSKSFNKDSDNYYGQYKDVKVAAGSIWIKFSRSPLYGFNYSTENGLAEIFYYEYDYSSEPYEFQLYDSLLFLTHFNGIQILDPYSRSFIREKQFGSRHLEESPFSVAADLDNKVLYISLVVYGISGIVAYDISIPDEPVIMPGYLALGFASEEMIFENGLLYVLTPSGLAVYLPQTITSIDNKDNRDFFKLQQNYPNPFNSTTKIKYSVNSPRKVSIKIYDLLGQEISTLVNNFLPAGEYEIILKPNELSSGIFFYRIEIGKYSETKKLILLK